MKRYVLILILLLLLGTVYADGPRYRFRSRRALQNLWRNEKIFDNSGSLYGSERKLSARELQGESGDQLAENRGHAYGVIVTTNPFSNAGAKGSGILSGDADSDGVPGKGDVTFGKRTDGGGHIVITPKDPPSPFIGGNVDPKKGQGLVEPPYIPVGDGLPFVLILSVTLIVIKMRLSSRG